MPAITRQPHSISLLLHLCIYLATASSGTSKRLDRWEHSRLLDSHYLDGDIAAVHVLPDCGSLYFKPCQLTQHTDVAVRVLQADHPSKHGSPYLVAEAEDKAKKVESFDEATMPTEV